MLSEIAEILAKEMGIADWKCSNRFLEKFKKQQNIYGTKNNIPGHSRGGSQCWTRCV